MKTMHEITPIAPLPRRWALYNVIVIGIIVGFVISAAIVIFGG